MIGNIIQAKYDDLEAIAERFSQWSDASTGLHGRIQRCAESLAHGGWEGRGSDAFFAEMQGAVLPALQRLHTALAAAQAVTQEVKNNVLDAEEQAAQDFRRGALGAQSYHDAAHRTLQEKAIATGSLESPHAGTPSGQGGGGGNASSTEGDGRARRGGGGNISQDPNRSFAYSVPGVVPPLQQPSSMSCWATVATMMCSWRDRKSYTITDAMKLAGQDYVRLYEASFDEHDPHGLPGDKKVDLLNKLHLHAESPASYTPDAVLQMLHRHGPLWVTTDENWSEDGGIHARIIAGIHGDGTPSGTMLQIIDPATGQRGEESFNLFVGKYEQVANGDIANDQPLRAQIVHF